VATPVRAVNNRPVDATLKTAEVKPQKATNTVTPKTVMHRQQIPILCYHQIREWKPSDSKTAKDYIVPVEKFRAQIKTLAEAGYHTILPDQLYDYLVNGTTLPSKPIMLTYDDTRGEQFTIAREEMNKYGFKGVFFVMTVSLGRPGYMTKEEVKQLSDEGNVIGSHTWDHHNVKNYTAKDWPLQVDKPSQQLEKITGKPIDYFAYPFGLWNKAAIEQLKERHFKAAFQLSEKRDENDPLFTIRRIVVPGEWSTSTLEKSMTNSFH
jgi:peptidoglycan/xylan/chitin deacetylase (PgdA/CDA1 family)